MKKQKLFWILSVGALALVMLVVWFWNSPIERRSFTLNDFSQEVPSSQIETQTAEESVPETEASEMDASDSVKDSQDQTPSPQVIPAEKISEDKEKSATENRSPSLVVPPEQSQLKEKNEEPTKVPSGVVNRLVDFGFASSSKPRTIDTIILHSSYDASGDDPYSVKGIIDQWKVYGVSPHYLVGRNGTVYRLVKDQDIAYHAGVAKVPDGRTNVNEFSLGIEIANTKTDDYTDAQYAALKKLIASLKDKYKIKYVLGHDDIAPGRKTDPWNFDWKKI